VRAAAAGSLLALLGACAPVVTHGPRVEPGPHAGIAAGLLLAPESAGVPDAVTPELAPYVRYGWAARPGGFGASLALSLDPNAESRGVGVDAYLQGPSGGSALAYGAGVTRSAGVVMPYLQAGRDLGRGYELYTTQGYVHRTRFTEKHVGILEERTAQARPRYWAPSLAVRTRSGAVAASLQLTGAFGHYEERPGPDAGPVVRRRLRAAAASVAGEVDLVRLVREGLGSPPRPAPPRRPR